MRTACHNRAGVCLVGERFARRHQTAPSCWSCGAIPRLCDRRPGDVSRHVATVVAVCSSRFATVRPCTRRHGLKARSHRSGSGDRPQRGDRVWNHHLRRRRDRPRCASTRLLDRRQLNGDQHPYCDRVIIHAGCRIGQDGFVYLMARMATRRCRRLAAYHPDDVESAPILRSTRREPRHRVGEGSKIDTWCRSATMLRSA